MTIDGAHGACYSPRCYAPSDPASDPAGEPLRAGNGNRNRRQHVALIVGPTGAGKSTLANKILDHPDYDIFVEGVGLKGGVTTTTQKGSWGDLVVIDTPGVPSVDTSGSLKHFDAIVELIRRERTLSTLIFLIHEERATSPEQLREYRVILEQLNNLPCSKLVVCRQAELIHRTKRTEEDRTMRGERVVEHALEDSGLNMPLLLLTDGYTQESNQQVSQIVDFIRRSERVAVDVPSLRTSDELRQFLCDLADRDNRLAALRQETLEIEDSLWHRRLLLASHMVPLAYLSATSMGMGSLSTEAYVRREQEEGGRIRGEITRRYEEIEGGKMDEELFKAVRERLSDLDYLCGY